MSLDLSGFWHLSQSRVARKAKTRFFVELWKDNNFLKGMKNSPNSHFYGSGLYSKKSVFKCPTIYSSTAAFFSSEGHQSRPTLTLQKDRRNKNDKRLFSTNKTGKQQISRILFLFWLQWFRFHLNVNLESLFHKMYLFKPIIVLGS